MVSARVDTNLQNVACHILCGSELDETYMLTGLSDLVIELQWADQSCDSKYEPVHDNWQLHAWMNIL